jgi:hypothetical protein
MKCSEGPGSRSRLRLRRSASSHHVLCAEDGPYLADRGAVIRGSVREMLAIPKRVHESVALLIRSSSRVSAFALAASRKSARPCWRVAGEGGRFPMKHGGVMAIPKGGDQSKCHLDGSRFAGCGSGSMVCSVRVSGREERRAPRPIFMAKWEYDASKGDFWIRMIDSGGALDQACAMLHVLAPVLRRGAGSFQRQFLEGAGDLGPRGVREPRNKLPLTPDVPVSENQRRPRTRLTWKLRATPCAPSPSRSCPANWDTQERRRIPQPCPASALLFGISEFTKWLGGPGQSARDPRRGRA